MHLLIPPRDMLVFQSYTIDEVLDDPFHRERISSILHKLTNDQIRNGRCPICNIGGSVFLDHMTIGEGNSQHFHRPHLDLFALVRAEHDKKKFTVRMMNGDHILPHSLGGTNAYTNIRIMCIKCNTMRRNAINDNEWAMIVNNPHDHVSPGSRRTLFEEYALGRRSRSHHVG